MEFTTKEIVVFAVVAVFAVYMFGGDVVKRLFASNGNKPAAGDELAARRIDHSNDDRVHLLADLAHIRDAVDDCDKCTEAIDQTIAPRIMAQKAAANDAS
jgi:hypothetical protein